jgi:lipopolysaccharide/colanic/teichoic acid biosynthesis glycosyltransferase
MIASQSSFMSQASGLTARTARPRTVWGLDPVALHHRFWASRGVQVVRQGEPSEIVDHAELYLLTDPRSFVIFPMSSVMETLTLIKPSVLFIRLHDDRERGYRERVVTDASSRFIRFQRLYDASEDLHLARAVLTPDRDLAQLWQSSSDPLTGWRRLRRYTPRHERLTVSVDGHVFDRSLDREIGLFLHELMRSWRRPDSTIARASLFEPQVWADPQSRIDPDARFIGPVWIGAGRHVPAGTTVIGPTIFWDDPGSRPPTEDIQWLMIEPREIPREGSIKTIPLVGQKLKYYVFDKIFALLALLVTLPFYPLIMLAIWWEDGRPFFFSQRRETSGGREFGCLKFRSMKKNAEQLKDVLRTQNQADGPQFFLSSDPRLTRVGRFLRKYDLDEWPQFINVLLGDMSVVGPRPSPRVENQYCPPWREARLSVRPGITGLWQIRRTRQIGSDFQEWIKYDLQYVENRSWSLDLWIIWKTIMLMVRKVSRT